MIVGMCAERNLHRQRRRRAQRSTHAHAGRAIIVFRSDQGDFFTPVQRCQHRQTNIERSEQANVSGSDVHTRTSTESPTLTAAQRAPSASGSSAATVRRSVSLQQSTRTHFFARVSPERDYDTTGCSEQQTTQRIKTQCCRQTTRVTTVSENHANSKDHEPRNRSAGRGCWETQTKRQTKRKRRLTTLPCSRAQSHSENCQNLSDGRLAAAHVTDHQTRKS